MDDRKIVCGDVSLFSREISLKDGLRSRTRIGADGLSGNRWDYGSYESMGERKLKPIDNG
jgi:hypothetical protein